jgi:hypothetical protein
MKQLYARMGTDLPQFRFRSQSTFALFVIILILGLCYSYTIAPDITWAHFSADGGDLITATATGGVPHPGGYPLYLILARSFQLIPVGSLAFRTNLFSAVCTILAALVLYLFLVHHLPGYSHARLISLFAALAYGFAPVVWGQALVTEVYALHGLVLIACLYVLTAENLKVSDWTRGFIFGIAATNHLTSAAMFPLLLLNFRGRFFVSPRTFLIRCLGIVSGLSLYLWLPIRASFDPPVNWGNASTLDGFFWLVSGQLYYDYFFGLTFADIIQRLGSFAALLLDQYTWIGVLVGIYGLTTRPPRRVLIPTLWMGIIFLVYTVFYGSYDSQVNLLPVWLVFAIWIAYGLQDLFELAGHRFRRRAVLAALFFAVLLVRIPFSFRHVDASKDLRARDFIDSTLHNIPKDSLAFIDGDKQVFSLWYAQFALHRRTDIVMIASDLLPYQWYVENLEHTYPNATIPVLDFLQPAHLSAANPERVVCYISADQSLKCP